MEAPTGAGPSRRRVAPSPVAAVGSRDVRFDLRAPRGRRLATSFAVVACVGDDASPTDAADAAVDATAVDAGAAVDATPDSSTVDATPDAIALDAAPIDAGPPLPTTVCTAQPLNGANIRCAANPFGQPGGGSIAVGNYILNNSFGPTCKVYMYGAATIYQEGQNLFMRWLRIEDRVNPTDPGVQRSGTTWLRPSSTNRIERIEVCDPGNVGKSEVGTFGVAGNGNLELHFGTYVEGWQKVP